MWMQKAQRTGKNSILNFKIISHQTSLFTQFPIRPWDQTFQIIFLFPLRTPFFLALMQEEDEELFQAILDYQNNIDIRGPRKM